MTSTKTKTILESCDIWDIDYNSDNWELEIMTIYVSWQLRVTLDSIRNSCDVFEQILQTETCWFFPHTDIDNSGRGCIDCVQRQNARKYPQNTLCPICRLESRTMEEDASISNRRNHWIQCHAESLCLREEKEQNFENNFLPRRVLENTRIHLCQPCMLSNDNTDL